MYANLASTMDEDSDCLEYRGRPKSPTSSISSGGFLTHSRSQSPARDAVAKAIQSQRTCNHRQRVVIEYQEGDIDLDDLWNPEVGHQRDHLLPPELTYNTCEEALQVVHEWGKGHGVAYSIQKRYPNAEHYHKVMLTCTR